MPVPEKPELHPHSLEPMVLVHVAYKLQNPFSAAHSSMSVHVTPSPRNPELHSQFLDPSVFVHRAFGSHSPLRRQ